MVRDDPTRRRRKALAAECEAGPAARKTAKAAPPIPSIRGGKGANVGDAEKRKGDRKGADTKTCVVCPDKPARDHLKAEDHRADSVFWREECWSKYQKGGWQEEVASS